ncbi:MAG: DNA polymerase III subunit delta [Pseudomonadales bacterium]|nr:DNA polymerase III subunit delta [Pseudomonadales bacterium]
MQIRAEQLQRHLEAGDLRHIYLVSGDEQLLVDEACDDIVAAATDLGYDERTIFEAVARAPWDDLFADAGNLSLFATKRLLDVRIPPRGLDRAGSEAIRGYLEAPLPDTLVLCRAAGLDWRQRSNAWYKAIDRAGAVIPVWPVSGRDLPRWLDGRCRRQGLELGRDALDALAERVEGNLLAAVQEIAKLKLLHGEGRLGVAEIESGVGDAAHFDTFELIDAAFAGRGARVQRMLGILRQEGVAVFMVIAALASQLQRAAELAAGANPRIARSRLAALNAAVRRLGPQGVDELHKECALLDLQSKGMLRGDAWQSLERVLLGVAGVPQPKLSEEADLLRI